MITGRDIVLISSIDWSNVWQVPQEIGRRFAGAGNRVLFVENTGVRGPAAADLGRVGLRFGRWLSARRTAGFRPCGERLYVCSPLVLPPFGPRWRRWINRRLLLPRIAGAARRLEMRDPLLWTFLPTDSAYEIMQSLRSEHSIFIYYCAADFTRLTPHAASLELSERKILGQCDVVFVTCTGLERRCRTWNQNVHICPHGVDLSVFPAEEVPSGGAGSTQAAEQDLRRLRALPRPVIGFVGGLHRFVDFALLSEMACARPDWTWVFVGPSDSSATALAGRTNIHLFGHKPHEDMVHYIRCFDVGIVPYVKNIRTSTVLPVKINEYLAAGRPVVSTDLEPVEEFNARHQVLTTSENRPAPFLRAIEQALHSVEDKAAAARRRAVASQYDWPICMERMCALIEKRP